MLNDLASLSKATTDFLFKSDAKACEHSAQNELKPFFAIALFFYIVYVWAMQPGWVSGGEMWAEMATNYFLNANEPSYFQKFFATDAGYIPLPQRLIAFLGNAFNLPAASIPYFYSFSALILTGLMVGSFCLLPFRILVKSDALRFFTVLVVLMTADFESRTFVNFTYFAAFFIAVLTALAWVDDSDRLPWWAWFIPILMLSKPAVLAILPAMIFVAMTRRSSFRWITIATIFLCLGQFIQMFVSQKAGVMPFRGNEITLVSKLIASGKYFFGFLGGYSLGQFFHVNRYFSMLLGLLVLSGSCFVIFRKRNNAGALILVGLSLLFFNVFLNAFALSDSWNRDLARLVGLPVYRHIIVGFFGCVLVVSGMIASLMDDKCLKLKCPMVIHWGPILLGAWFVLSGWFFYATRLSREPVSPLIQNSQWQNMAHAIDSGISPLCVPIDPIGWMYAKNCKLLNPGVNFRQPYRFEAAHRLDDSIFYEINPPASLTGNTLVSLAVLLKPLSMQTNSVNAKAIFSLKDGSRFYYAGGRRLALSGGMMLLTSNDFVKIKDIVSVKFVFDAPVEIAMMADAQINDPVVMWMGF